MLDLIRQRLAEHRERIAAGKRLLRDLAAEQETIAREVQQREGAVLALVEIEQVMAGAEEGPAEGPEAV